MKVIHTVFAYDSGRFRGGVTKAAAELAAAQASIGLDVEIWAPCSGGEMLVTRDGELTVRQFPATRFAGMDWSPALGKALMGLRPRTVVHSHSIFAIVNWQTARAARSAGLSLFAHCHGAIAPELIGTLDAKALKKRTYSTLVEIPNLNSARAVFALTEVERQRILACRVKSPIEVVPNGVVLPALGRGETVHNLRNELGLGPSDIIILYLGRINPIKRIEDIIDAFQLSAAGDARFHLVIAGSATTAQQYYRGLQRRAAAIASADRVHWIGHVTEVDKPAVFGAADLFVHASRSEGMSMAILEAMSFGKCVVATEGCNMSRAAAAGALVEVPGDPVSLAEAFVSLARTEERRAEFGRKARQFVSQRHNWTNIGRQMASIYESAMRVPAWT